MKVPAVEKVAVKVAPATGQLSVMVIAPVATEKVLPDAIETGCPVQLKYHQRSGVPASSHSSPETIDHVDPPFVHDAESLFVVEPLDAEFHVTTEPPEVYPVPDSSVPAEVADDADVVSRSLMPVDAPAADPASVALIIELACA